MTAWEIHPVIRVYVSFAIVLPPDEPERERDKLCPYCASLIAPPDRSSRS